MTDDYQYPNSRAKLPVLSAAGTPPTPPGAGASSPSPAPPSDPAQTIEHRLLEGKIIEAISQVYDPEIPLNIYELGLIYGIDIAADKSVKIRMTLTAPGCPVAGSLPAEVARKVEAIPDVKAAEVELVWDPPWDKSKLTEAALLQLGLL